MVKLSAMAKNPAAVELGRRGGKARLTTMTAEERKAVAKKAIAARWEKYRKDAKNVAKKTERALGKLKAADTKRAHKIDDLLKKAKAKTS